MAMHLISRACKFLSAALVLAGPTLVGQVRADDTALAALALGDECSAADGSDCALSALQHRGERLSGGAAAAAKAEAEVAAEVAAASAAASEAEMELYESAAAQAEAAEEAERLIRAEVAAEEAADSLRALLSPRLRYNSSAFGGRRAPAVATQYDGLEDEREFEIQADADGFTHVFAIGDWGATLPGHYTAPNKRGPGQKCPNNCQYSHGIDDRAQILVANVMKQRAATSNPQYVLNVGDNFYWSGIPEDCSATHADGLTYKEFSQGWQGVYAGLANKPWISALGNHDYGGWQFNHGWPQQIGYSFVNRNWVLPARYFSKVMNHPGFSVEYFVIDTNAFDAKEPSEDPEHNICGQKHTPSNANCASGGGPASVASCKSWFWSGYYQQKAWLKAKLSASRADWQVVVTHFPCGTDAGFFRMLHQYYGLDLLVTGHRHDQELWSNSGLLGGMTCFVTGGGGGITSERPTGGSMSSTQYGFFDITMSKTKMHLELVALTGNTIKSSWVYPKAKR